MKALSIALFAGLVMCALLQPMGMTQAATYNGQTLYNFCSVQPACKDGSFPAAGLVAMADGLLYGTTTGTVQVCGTSSCFAHGTLFSLDPATGTEKVLYSFCSLAKCADGAIPLASMIDVNGLLYGTTVWGGGPGCGGNGCGTLFSFDPSTGVEKVLYTFCRQTNCADGAYPSASVIDLNGVLYGTTGAGGNQNCHRGCGTVFSINPTTGVEKVLYSFCSQAKCADGKHPYSNLVPINGSLYGTTEMGGVAGCGGSNTCGTVFAFDLRASKETVVHAFCSEANCADGALPLAGLVDLNGTLYGTTEFGGGYPCQNQPVGCGTAFALDPNTGTLTVLHSFGNREDEDAYHPETGLVAMKGKLYGTTIVGGSEHTGAAFSLDPSTGQEAVIWSFCSANCEFPSELIGLNGKLYGTLQRGGTHSSGIAFVISKTH